MDEAASSSVKSVVRVIDLFELLAHWGGEKTHAQIASDLGIPKSSLTQLLRTLTVKRYLTYSATTRGYQLGPALTELADRSSRFRDLVTAAEPVLADLTRTTKESSALNLLKGDRVEVVAVATSQNRLHYLMEKGDSAPLYANSSGLAILAHLPDSMIDDYLAWVEFEQFAPNTPRTADDVRGVIRRVREAGYAQVEATFTPGVAGFAVPILDGAGYPLAALNVAMPLLRLTDTVQQQILAALKTAAERLSHVRRR